jgi:hypothetical protein
MWEILLVHPNLTKNWRTIELIDIKSKSWPTLFPRNADQIHIFLDQFMDYVTLK